MRGVLVDDCRLWWRWWSLRLIALGALIQGVDLLGLWRLMPDEVRDAIPSSKLRIVGALVFALSFAARLVKQRIPEVDHGK